MITEELLGAYLEGNLSDQENTYVERELANDPDLQDLADDVYAYVDEPAPYELDLDDIDLPVIDAESDELTLVEVEPDDEPVFGDWEEDTLIDDSVDDFDFIDDPCDDL